MRITRPSRACDDQCRHGAVRAGTDQCDPGAAVRHKGAAMNAKSRLLTFLFTDIEGSTLRWEADADAMRVALEFTTAYCAKRSKPTMALPRPISQPVSL